MRPEELEEWFKEQQKKLEAGRKKYALPPSDPPSEKRREGVEGVLEELKDVLGIGKKKELVGSKFQAVFGIQPQSVVVREGVGEAVAFLTRKDMDENLVSSLEELVSYVAGSGKVVSLELKVRESEKKKSKGWNLSQFQGISTLILKFDKVEDGTHIEVEITARVE